MSETILWKLFIVLLLGTRPVGPAAQAVLLRQCFTQPVPIYAEADVSAIRRMMADAPELQEIVFDGQDPAVAYEEAAGQLSGMLKTASADVKRAFESVRGAGLWVLGLEDRTRVLLVLDCGEARGVLDGLLRGLADDPQYRSTSYAGTTVCGLGAGDDALWMAEQDGRVALALDLLTVQEFLLAAREVPREGARAPAAGPPPMLYAELAGGPLLAMLRSQGFEDVVAVLLDMPSWKKLTASFDGRHLEVCLEVDPEGRLAQVLLGPNRPPKLLAAVPDSAPIAVVVSLKDPMELYRLIRMAVAEMYAGAQDAEGEFWEEFRHDTGLDLEKDVFANVTEAAYIVGQMESGRDLLERAVFVFETRDAGKARGSVEVLVNAVARGGAVEVAEVNGATIWHVRDTCVALKGGTVVMAEERNAALNSVLEQLGGPTSMLAEQSHARYPHATSAFIVNLAAMTGRAQAEPVLGGLWFGDNRLTMQADVDIASLGGTLSGVRTSRETGRRAACTVLLHQLGIACHQYANDHQGALPPDLAALQPAYIPDARVLVCPVSGKAYVYRREAAGRTLKDIVNPVATVLAHDAADAHPGGGHVAYADGHVEWLGREAFWKAIGWPPAVAPVRPQ